MTRILATAIAILITAAASAAEPASTQPATRVDGYRGIWFTLGQKSEHGDKYSGGLGTYTANHVPIAIYSAKANKTFFVYGGTRPGERHLLIMASYFDHATKQVPRPVIVYDKLGVNDPHDNAALAIDDDGFLWIFVSGRAKARPGFLFRSSEPFSIDRFDQIDKREMTYPQPKFIPGEGFFYLFTKYTNGRELYWQTSRDGRAWTPDQKLAGFGGHYQVSGRSGKTIGSAFMWHPGGRVDDRTNLYYVQTRDLGKTWTTVDGKVLKTPLESEKNDALLIDYQAEGMNVYIHDLNFDSQGHPVILYLTSKGAKPGPENGERQWRLTRWDGLSWKTSDVCTSDHNYDTGCLFIDGNHWTIVGPTDPGPQPMGAGGEMVIWSSDDQGKNWEHRAMTTGSKSNHSYARRPLNAAEPFTVFWADGDPNQFSESHLYFGSAATGHVWMLPYDMKEDFAKPVRR